MTPDEIKRRAVFWFSGLAFASTLLSALALLALASGVPHGAALLMAVNLAIPGLAISKWRETCYLWQGLDGDPRSETWATMPGLLAIAACLVCLWIIVIPLGKDQTTTPLEPANKSPDLSRLQFAPNSPVVLR